MARRTQKMHEKMFIKYAKHKIQLCRRGRDQISMQKHRECRA